MDLTKINTFWRQIARIRAGVANNNKTHAHTPGTLSYTAGEGGEERAAPAGNNLVVVWAYWKHEAGNMVATKEDVKTMRNRCKAYTGLTINGEELFVVERDKIEEMKNTGLLCVVGVYDLKLFE